MVKISARFFSAPLMARIAVLPTKEVMAYRRLNGIDKTLVTVFANSSRNMPKRLHRV